MRLFSATLLVLLIALSGCKTTADSQDNSEAQGNEPEEAAASQEQAEQAPFAGCEVTQFASGWIEAACADARFLIQPDLAILATIDQTWTPMSAALSKEFDADVYGEEIELDVDGSPASARSFDVKKTEEGAPLVSGVYALWDMSDTAKMAAACIQDPEAFDRDRCTRGFSSLAQDGLPGPDFTTADEESAELVLAGKSIAMSDDCERTADRKVSCENGELTWFQGEAEASQEKIDAALDNMKSVASASGADIQASERPCEIGDVETTCTLHEIKSDAQHAKFHSAMVDLDDEKLAIVCWYDAVQDAPGVCEAIFGGDE